VNVPVTHVPAHVRETFADPAIVAFLAREGLVRGASCDYGALARVYRLARVVARSDAPALPDFVLARALVGGQDSHVAAAVGFIR
jgi:hypothetical protein